LGYSRFSTALSARLPDAPPSTLTHRDLGYYQVVSQPQRGLAMPNRHPTQPARRTRPLGPLNARGARDVLPPGMDLMRDGRIRHRYTVNGQRRTIYGWSVDEVNAKRYAPAPKLPGVIDAQTTLAEYLELWAAGLAIRPNSKAEHVRNVQRRLIPLFGTDVLLTQVNRPMVAAKLAELRDDGRTRDGKPLAPRTVAIIYGTLRAALQKAADDMLIPANPASRQNPNGTTGKAARSAEVGLELSIPTAFELRRVRKAVEGHPWADLLEFAAATGVRQSELLGLTWPDVDTSLHRVRIRRRLQRNGRTLDDPKNRTSSRMLAFSDRIAAQLVARKRAQELQELIAGDLWSNPDNLVFTDGFGRPLHGSSVTHWYQDNLAKLGMPRYRWHDLRHFFASELIARGVPIETVSKLLGHADVTITSKTYHHLLPATGVEAVAVIESALA